MIENNRISRLTSENTKVDTKTEIINSWKQKYYISKPIGHSKSCTNRKICRLKKS
jgi:hypothetical protein